MNLRNKKAQKAFFGAIISLFLVFPVASFAGTPAKLTYSAWLPYWKKATSTEEALAHLNTFSEISPFSYTVKSDGTLVDTAKMTQEPWTTLFSSAQKQKVKVIPSILWTDANAMHTVLKTYTLRLKHEKAIVDLVVANNFDGIDIDYEQKKADTKKYFSYFLQELSTSLHKKKKILTCTIEPRTPLDSRFAKIPDDIEYANDYIALNKYCDSVRIMTYDQGIVDLSLNSQKGSMIPYVPVSDPVWVTKVVNLATRSISAKKIVIGIPTYGYEFKVTPRGKTFQYERIKSINHTEALELAFRVGAMPQRTASGEMSFSYTNSADISTTSPQTSSQPFRLVWWSDASAVADKISVAKKLGVKGVVIFKIDGGEDQDMWNKFQ